MRLFFFFGCFLLFYVTAAQDRCVTSSYILSHLQASSSEAKDITNAQNFLTKNFLQRQETEETVIRIPVVVHVLYNNTSQNISLAQIKSGIAALNRDFRRQSADTVNTPQRFKSIAADVQLEFALATADALGRGTDGIVRKQVSRAAWLADDRMKSSVQGGDDAWDCKSYLNIWIVELVGASGYSSVPGSNAATDGVVIHYKAFGTINTDAPFSLGRTAVHEVGHWLGLKHIWGDAQCGDDGVSDTPQQGFFTKGCPSNFRSSCSNAPLGDMYMNYMDYTDDACMNLFTAGQRARMRAAFDAGGPRATLLASKGLNKPWAMESPLPLPVTEASLYPNPAQGAITVRLPGTSIGKTVSVYNSQGQLQKAEIIRAMQQTINITNLKPGVYFVKGEGYSQKFVKL